jgi:hypothetical protein
MKKRRTKFTIIRRKKEGVIREYEKFKNKGDTEIERRKT